MSHALTRLRADASHRPGGLGLLVRHAERPEITDPARALQLGLTERGRAAARELGRQLLDLQPAAVFASPVDRCVDTAACLLEGLGVDPREARQTVRVERELAEACSSDGRLVRKQFLKRDPYQLILDYLAGQPVPGFRPLAEGAGRLLAALLAHLTPGRLTVFVSHDALIMALQRVFHGREFSTGRWLPFLEGSVLYADGDRVQLDGRTIERSLRP
jgi:broad specificity phosphatase PhoE